MKQNFLREWQRFKGRCIYSSAGLILAWREEHSFRFLGLHEYNFR